MTLSEYSINKPVTVLLVFIALIGLGIFCTTQLPVDMYPNMKLPYMLPEARRTTWPMWDVTSSYRSVQDTAGRRRGRVRGSG